MQPGRGAAAGRGRGARGGQAGRRRRCRGRAGRGGRHQAARKLHGKGRARGAGRVQAARKRCLDGVPARPVHRGDARCGLHHPGAADGAVPLRAARAHLRALRLQRGAAALRGPRCGGRGPEVCEQRHLLSVHPGHGSDHGSGHVRQVRHRQAGRAHHADRRRLPCHELHLAHPQGAQVGGPVAYPGHRHQLQGLGRSQPRLLHHAGHALPGGFRAAVRRPAHDVSVPHASLRG